MKNTKNTKDLKLEDVPHFHASIKKINEFALSFDSEEQKGQLLEENLNSNFESLELGTLRAILFIEQRRWNHFGEEYDKITENRIRILIKVLREKLERS